MKISAIIPARNEENYIGKCIESIKRSLELVDCESEIIVVLNRCTDNTESIAREMGAKLVKEDSKNLSIIRNAGVNSATGEVVFTIDADSEMSEGFIKEATEKLISGKIIGGGCRFIMDKKGIAIWITLHIVRFITWLINIAGGCFWFFKRDFEKIGGFDEEHLTFEDVFFAKKLKYHGKATGRKFVILQKNYITTSARKIDKFGGWHFFIRPWLLWKYIKGNNREIADKYWYDFHDGT